MSTWDNVVYQMLQNAEKARKHFEEHGYGKLFVDGKEYRIGSIKIEEGVPVDINEDGTINVSCDYGQ